MVKRSLFVLMAILLLSSCAKNVTNEVQVKTITESEESSDEVNANSLDEKFAYVYGYQLINTITTSIPDLNIDYFLEGVKAFKNSDYLFSAAESQEIMNEYQDKIYKEHEEKMKAAGEKNLAAAQSFLQTNQKRSGVVSVSDKLQIEYLREGSGDGKKATSSSIVTVDYQLVTLNGDIKDSSYARGQSSTFDLSNNIIDGFRSAVACMKEGDKIRAWVHPDLGYGINGSSNIEPNQLLIFDIELLKVE